jgi:hypothetical protein
MSRLLWLLLGAAAINLCACNRHPTPPASGQAQPHKTPELSVPHRKPGYWAQRVSGPAGDQASWLCIDEATDAKVSPWASPADPSRCPHIVYHARDDGSWDFATECDHGENGHERAAGTAGGDFQASYSVAATSTITGAKAQEMNGVRHFTLTAEWVGAQCPGGLKPGQLQTSGGMVDLVGVK